MQPNSVPRTSAFLRKKEEMKKSLAQFFQGLVTFMRMKVVCDNSSLYKNKTTTAMEKRTKKRDITAYHHYIEEPEYLKKQASIDFKTCHVRE